MSRKQVIFWTIAVVLIIDQLSKMYIKTNIEYGQGFDILGLSWAKIHFIENNGMAFGLSYGGEIEVISPIHLRDKIADRVVDMIQNYNL